MVKATPPNFFEDTSGGRGVKDPTAQAQRFLQGLYSSLLPEAYSSFPTIYRPRYPFPTARSNEESLMCHTSTEPAHL